MPPMIPPSLAAEPWSARHGGIARGAPGSRMVTDRRDAGARSERTHYHPPPPPPPRPPPLDPPPREPLLEPLDFGAEALL